MSKASASRHTSEAITLGGNEGRDCARHGRLHGPEQARGQSLDKRTDIWTFGCVLYEVLSGKQAFPGATLSDTLATVLERDPDWSVLPRSTPANIAVLLRRCLHKDASEGNPLRWSPPPPLNVLPYREPPCDTSRQALDLIAKQGRRASRCWGRRLRGEVFVWFDPRRPGGFFAEAMQQEVGPAGVEDGSQPAELVATRALDGGEVGDGAGAVGMGEAVEADEVAGLHALDSDSRRREKIVGAGVAAEVLVQHGVEGLIARVRARAIEELPRDAPSIVREAEESQYFKYARTVGNCIRAMCLYPLVEDGPGVVSLAAMISRD